MRAMELFAEVAGAQPAAGAIDVYPAPIERPRITVRTARVNALLGTELAADEIQRAARHRSASRPRGPAPTSSPSRRRSGPTSNARSTSSRRSRGGSGSRTSRARCRRTRRRSARSRPAQRERRALADVLVGAGYDEAYTLPLLAPADLTRAGTDRLGVDRGREPAARRGVAPASRVCCPACCVRRRSTPRTAHRRRRAVRARVPCSRRRAGRHRCRASRCTSRDGPRRAVSGARRTNPIGPSTAADVVAVVEALAEELRLADWRLEAVGDAPGFHPTRAGGVIVDGERVGRRRRSRAERASPRSISPSPVVAFELDVGRCSPAVGGGHAACALVSRFPASSIDLAFVVDDTVPAGDVRATLRDGRRRAARSRSSSSTSSVRMRSAPGRVSLAFTVLVPGAGPHAHRRRGRRALRQAADRRRRRAPTAPSCARLSASGLIRSRTASGSGTPRSTVKASCSTRTGSRTSTTRARASWSRSASDADFWVSRVRRDAGEGGRSSGRVRPSFDDWIDIAVAPARLGTKSFDLRSPRPSRAGRPARRRSRTSPSSRAATRRCHFRMMCETP